MSEKQTGLLAVGVAVSSAVAYHAVTNTDDFVAKMTQWTTWVAVVGAVAVIVVAQLAYRFRAALFGKVDYCLDKHGGQLVAQVIKAHGVKFVFTLVGGHISPILVATKKLGVRIIDVRHEATACFAADAVARLTGVPGVVAVTAGPGLTNTVTAVKNAQMAESPVVIISGAAATLAQGRGALQDIDQMAIMRPLVKYAASCRTVRDIVPVMRRAFHEAASGTPGPVFVELPIDLLYPVMEVHANLALSKRLHREDVTEEQHSLVTLPSEAKKKSMTVKQWLDTRKHNQGVFLRTKSRMSPVVKAYLQFSIRNLFADSLNRSWDVSPIPVTVPTCSTSQLNKALSILACAHHPVFLIASQATVVASECAGLAKNLTDLGVPCFLGGMSRGLPGRNSRFHIRQNRRGALKQADAIFLIGSYCDFRLDYGRVFPKRAKVVAVNRSNFHLKRNTDLFWSPTLAIQADPAQFVKALTPKAMQSQWFQARREGWLKFGATLKQGEVKKELANAEKAKQPAYGRAEGKEDGAATRRQLVNPLRLVSDLEQVLSDKSILIGDGGDFIATAAYVTRPRGPLTWLDPGAFGTLGVGGGFALGAKLCKPDHDVWLLWGDGSVGYSVAEFDTFKRHNVPIIALIGNDACWSQIEREQVPMLGDDVACPLEYTSYEEVAKYYGGEGVQVSDPTTDIQAVLATAQQRAREGTPVCVNVLIGKSDFRKGSISV